MLFVFYKIGAVFRGIIIHIVHSLSHIFCRIYLKTVNCIVSLHLYKIDQRSTQKTVFRFIFIICILCILCQHVCAYDSGCAQQPDTPESSGDGVIVCHLTWVLARELRSPASLCKTIFPTTLKTTFRKKVCNLIQPCNQVIILDSRTVIFRS